MNAVAHVQLTFRILTLLQKHLYHQSHYSNTRDSKCLAMIALVVRTLGINPKVGVRVPLRSPHFLSLKFWHFHKNICSWVKNECCCLCNVNISNVRKITKILDILYIQDQNLVITMPADDLAPLGAKPSAGTMYTTKLDMCSYKFLKLN